MNGFKAGIRKLVQYGKSKVKHVFITGCYWKNDEKERAIMDVAKGCGISYISLEEIDRVRTLAPPRGIICTTWTEIPMRSRRISSARIRTISA